MSLLSPVYSGALSPTHLDDLLKSGLTRETIAGACCRSVPLMMLPKLLGFDPAAILSAYLIPYADPRGGWMDHVRMKIFPPLTTETGGTVKYFQPKRSGVRIYFPPGALDAALHSSERLFIVEGEKKALAVAQEGVPAIGLAGIDGWHVAGARALHPDLDDVGLRDREVRVIPDADYRTNPAVHRAVQHLGQALVARGARARLVHVPIGFKGIDDWLAATA